MNAPYYSDADVTLHLGDCLDVLRTLEADSIDAIVTDPPAGIAFMDREWDDFRRARNPADAGRDSVFGRTSAHGPEYGRRDRGQFVQMLTARLTEAYRVLKPGGHALVWSIPRTSHWTAWAIEDAGFDVRDCVLHLFGSGFPKSRDVAKAIDKSRRRDHVLAAVRLGMEIPGRNLDDWTKEDHSPGDKWWAEFKAHLSAEQWGAIEREVVGSGKSGPAAVAYVRDAAGEYDVTAPATADAVRWSGFGTALKPGQEMWWLARKPLKGTVAGNVLEFGTGALNIEACKVGSEQRVNNAGGMGSLQNVSRVEHGYREHVVMPSGEASEVTGRWPTNIAFTHSATCSWHLDCAPDCPSLADPDATPESPHSPRCFTELECADGCPIAELDRQSGMLTSGANPERRRSDKFRDAYGEFTGQETCTPHRGADSGGASRFYPKFRYQAKAPTSERPRLDDGTAHETVKSLGLMAWLVRLITPPGGTVLDMFAGSGPVGEVCIIEGFRCVLIEQDPKSAELIKTRLSKPIQPVMFGLEAS